MRRTSMGAAAAGALTVVGGSVFGDVASANAAAPKVAEKHHDVIEGSNVIAHVVNARTGEISILAGTKEIKYVNRELAQQIMRAAH
jgi:hypothetical protein